MLTVVLSGIQSSGYKCNALSGDRYLFIFPEMMVSYASMNTFVGENSRKEV